MTTRARRSLSCLPILAALAISFLRAEGLPRKGTLGVALGAMTPEVQAKNHLGDGEGILVTQVLPDLGGQKAGVKAGDVITALDGKAVTQPQLLAALAAMPAGGTVKLKILRDGSALELTATMVEKPRDPGTDAYEVIYSDVVSNGHRMRTLISKPKSPGKHPALMFIQGFSPISYDYDLNGKGLDAPLLYAFASDGFVTLRVDKPGVGDSEGGPFAQVDYVTELDIYRQALKQLKSLPYVDTDNVFIFGHSMGGAFGPMVASEIPVKGVALYGIEARTWHEYLLDTVRYQNLLGGSSYAEVDDRVRRGSRVMEMVFQDGVAPERIKKDHPDLAATVDETFPNGLFNNKVASFWAQLENTNFAAYWAKVDAHVLAVHGASDFVTYEVDHKLVADIVNSVHPGWGRSATAPSSDHLFSNWATEVESLQHFPQGEFNPAFTSILKEWIREVMKG